MKKINFEFFIARRISGKGIKENKNVMVKIATITVAISIAVMIIALAVLSGFKKEMTDKLVGFGAHVQVVHLDGNKSFETVAIEKNSALEERIKEIKTTAYIHPYAVKGGVVKTDRAMEGVMLKGVEKDYDWSFFNRFLTDGKLPVIGDSIRTKDIIISKSLANAMMLNVDDRVEMMFVRENKPPRRDQFKVSGIYDTGFEEMDMMMVVTDIRNVQRLNGWSENQITGYEVNTTQFDKLEQFNNAVYNAVMQVEEESDEGLNLMVNDITTRYPSLFDWLKAHNVNTAVLIIIMLFVALLNMISALLIIVLERTHMIGVLKALGMNNPSLQKMFVIRSGYIIAKGMIWGNIVGIGLALIQKYSGIIKLDQSGYFISHVPINLDLWWIIGFNIGAFILIITLLTIPTMIVSKIKPDSTIRYQ